jgi:hypothetical protein
MDGKESSAAATRSWQSATSLAKARQETKKKQNGRCFMVAIEYTQGTGWLERNRWRKEMATHHFGAHPEAAMGRFLA